MELEIKKSNELQNNIKSVKDSCFCRISDSVFSELKSLDDLIVLMGTTKDGYKISGVGEPHEFKSRLDWFKEYLKIELPEFSEEELLKFDKYFYKLRKMYEWHDLHHFLSAIEYELRNKYR